MIKVQEVTRKVKEPEICKEAHKVDFNKALDFEPLQYMVSSSIVEGTLPLLPEVTVQ